MTTQQEQRHIYYDHDLHIEAYNLGGIVQKFPNHFHEFYVVGFIYGGKRHLHTKGREYDVGCGDMILFNPHDNHYCEPVNGELLDYRALNIDADVMLRATHEITGENYVPHFTQNVIYQSDIAPLISHLYDAILRGAPKLEKEESLFFLLEQLLQEYSTPFEELDVPVMDDQIRMVCDYIEEHYAENITLDELVKMTSFGKSYLIRSFTRQLGLSPYRYLQTVRLDRSKRYLEQGVAPIEAAGMAGFSDQSHFTNFFKEFIGITPKQYQRIFQQRHAGENHEK